MIIRENRDSRCLSISKAQVSGAAVLSVVWVGKFSYPHVIWTPLLPGPTAGEENPRF